MIISRESKNSFHSLGAKGDGPVLGMEPNIDGFAVSPPVGGANADPAAEPPNELGIIGGGKLFLLWI